MTEGICVREVFKQTYDELAKRNPHQEIKLQTQARAEIANDSDWHRSRAGHFGYDSVNLFQFDKS